MSLILNADDWGRDARTTDSILACVRPGAVSSVSAMVFMEDSERAAAIARARGLDAGLHLNFTTPFSAPECPRGLRQRQGELGRYLHVGAEVHVMMAIDAIHRLYGEPADRIDGHHHMHLCANVLFRPLLPPGTLVRRNFSFRPGEKSLGNRLYRRFVDAVLARRHRLVDFFFSLSPLAPPERLQRIFSLARRFVVEVETHPVVPEEHRFFADGDLLRCAGELTIIPASAVRERAGPRRIKA